MRNIKINQFNLISFLHSWNVVETLVGVEGFEPSNTWTKTRRLSPLGDTPICMDIILMPLFKVKIFLSFIEFM